MQDELKTVTKEKNINGSSSIGLDLISYPKKLGVKDEVYIGLLDSKGQRTGEGSLTNGEYLYKGNWVNDKRNGFGIQVYKNGETFEGDWINGKEGLGRWHFDDGTYFYGKKFNGYSIDGEDDCLLGFMDTDLVKFR